MTPPWAPAVVVWMPWPAPFLCPLDSVDASVHVAPMATTVLHVRGIDARLWARVRAAAALGGQTLRQWVTAALTAYLEQTGHREDER